MSTAQLVSMGFASPPAYPQMELCARQARALALEGVAHERFMRIASTSAIETRCVAAEIAAILDASTSDRMRMFAPIARTLALSAAQEALARHCHMHRVRRARLALRSG
jgi:predicted naringenin-chalcone synthase